MERPRRTGKPPEEDKYITCSIRLPPALWAAVEAQAGGERGRSSFIRRAIENELRARSAARVVRTGAEHLARVRAARGALAQVPGSVDPFYKRKQQEIDLEEAGHERRWNGGD
jgi:hypothetical protein